MRNGWHALLILFIVSQRKFITMLIKVKNGDLYRQWIAYYKRYYPEMIPAERRTMAFINSTKYERPPLF